MNLRTLLTGILSVSLNASTCSGLAIAAVLMAPVAEAAPVDGPMSPAIFELSCLSAPYSPASDTVEEETKGNGCEDATACIQSTVRGEIQRSFSVIQTNEDAILFVASNLLLDGQSSLPSIILVSARNGPLYEIASDTSHQLQKLE